MTIDDHRRQIERISTRLTRLTPLSALQLACDLAEARTHRDLERIEDQLDGSEAIADEEQMET